MTPHGIDLTCRHGVPGPGWPRGRPDEAVSQCPAPDHQTGRAFADLVEVERGRHVSGVHAVLIAAPHGRGR